MDISISTWKKDGQSDTFRLEYAMNNNVALWYNNERWAIPESEKSSAVPFLRLLRGKNESWALIKYLGYYKNNENEETKEEYPYVFPLEIIYEFSKHIEFDNVLREMIKNQPWYNIGANQAIYRGTKPLSLDFLNNFLSKIGYEIIELPEEIENIEDGSEGDGFIYILSFPYFSEIKIGRTSNPDRNKLINTYKRYHPVAPSLIGWIQTSDIIETEKKIHKIYAALNVKDTGGREFFKFAEDPDLDAVIEGIKEIIK